MMPELFRIPGLDIPVYGYGLMMVIGFIAAVELAKFLARRVNINPDLFVTAGVIALVSGVIGARLSHVIENWSDFTRPELSFIQNVSNMLNIRSGGLTFYGGFLLAVPCTILYGVAKKVSIPVGMDVIAPCLMIGLAFGRVGCFMNGCCYGAESNVPWAVTFPYYSGPFLDQMHDHKLNASTPQNLMVPTPDGGMRLRSPAELKNSPELQAEAAMLRSNSVHPAQLYSTFNSLLIAAILIAYFTIPHVPGRVFAMMLMLEGATRFILEMLRVEPPVLGPLSFSMVISATLLWIGVAWWIFTADKKSQHETPDTSPQPAA